MCSAHVYIKCKIGIIITLQFRKQDPNYVWVSAGYEIHTRVAKYRPHFTLVDMNLILNSAINR